jgi:hypothetical protein
MAMQIVIALIGGLPFCLSAALLIPQEAEALKKAINDPAKLG